MFDSILRIVFCLFIFVSIVVVIKINKQTKNEYLAILRREKASVQNATTKAWIALYEDEVMRHNQTVKDMTEEIDRLKQTIESLQADIDFKNVILTKTKLKDLSNE